MIITAMHSMSDAKVFILRYALTDEFKSTRAHAANSRLILRSCLKISHRSEVRVSFGYDEPNLSF